VAKASSQERSPLRCVAPVFAGKLPIPLHQSCRVFLVLAGLTIAFSGPDPTSTSGMQDALVP
jgi:hypothetical protein